MKSLKEQIEDKCKHFAGTMNKKCDAGIEYDSVRNKNTRPFKMPCVKNSIMHGSSCDHLCYPTEEEVQKQLKEIESMGLDSVAVLVVIKTHIKSTGKPEGTVDCPVCIVGTVAFIQAEVNGHITAKCDKCDISLMEQAIES